MLYEHLTCYYLSGTGNSYRAAQWLAEAAEARGVESAVIPIDRAAPKQELQAGPTQLVGIYHPAHGLMPPWSMIKFLLQMPRGRGAHAAILSTRGGIRIGKLVLPGATGLGLFFPLLVLALKGFRVRAGLSIDMPINVINLHWGLEPHNVEHIRQWGRRRHARFVDAVLDGRRFFHPVNLLWEALWVALVFWLMPLFPLGYLLVGRLGMGKSLFADTRCKGCGLCAKYCPNQAIVMTGHKPRLPFWTYHCEACLRCMGFCKQHAVEASHLWLTVLILATMLLSAEPLGHAATALLGVHLVLPEVVWELVGIALSFPVIVLLYYVFFGMQRVRLLRLALSYATWTRYFKRRYHDPETDLKQLR
jgi:ferredoxin